MIHSESENTACSPMLTTVSSFLFSQHQKGWEKILCQQQKRSYLQTNMWYALIAYIIVNENYHWSSYHISFRSSDLYINTWTFNFLQKKIVSTLLLILTQYWICLFYLTSGFKTILIFTYTPFVGFLHFRRFLFFLHFCTIVDQNWTNQNHFQVHRNRVQLVWCHRRWSHQCKGISRFLNGFNQHHVKAVGD